MGLVPAAGASTVAVSGSTLAYFAEEGEKNELTITEDLAVPGLVTEVTVMDPGATIMPTAPLCLGGTLPNVPATCLTLSPTGFTFFGISLGDRSDFVNTSDVPATVADGYLGGDGDDTVSYQDTGANVIADPGGGANDGRDTDNDGIAEEEDAIAADVEDITGGEGKDLLQGHSGLAVGNVLRGRGDRDTLIGLDGDDSLIGGAGTDRGTNRGLFGGNGNDRLRGNAGSDRLDGGSGSDTAIYDDAGGGVFVNLETGTAPDDGDGSNDLLFAIENLIGSDSSDRLRGKAGQRNEIEALAGDDNIFVLGGPGDTVDCGPGTDSAIADITDFLTGDCELVDLGVVTLPGGPGGPGGFLECRGKQATIAGTPGRDVIDGTPERDVIVAFGGKDTVRGFRGNDLICGGKGPDRLLGNAGADVLIGGAKGDRLFGGKGRDLLKGKKGKDFLNGGRKADRLRGGKGLDRCKGGPGRDRVSGCER